jgi:hypothetical protein
MRAVKRQPKIGISNLMLKKLLLIGVGASSLLIADDAPIVQVQVSHTERMDFPSGGVLRMKNSTGDLTVEGWDRPDVEITTVKSTKSYHPKDRGSAEKSLDRIRLVPERKGDELAITTEFPKHAMLARLFLGVSEFELRYRIKVPRNARLIIEHDSGNLYIDDVAGDVHATNGIGQITLHLPQNGHYAFDAKSDLGAVDSDFPGPEQGKLFHLGHAYISPQPPTGAQKLYARIGYGDITILKIRQPAPPPPLHP